ARRSPRDRQRDAGDADEPARRAALAWPAHPRGVDRREAGGHQPHGAGQRPRHVPAHPRRAALHGRRRRGHRRGRPGVRVMEPVTERKERRKVLVRSWEQAEMTFARLARRPKHGGPARAIIGYATWLHQRWPGQVGEGQPNYAVKFHATDVVTFYPDGRIRLATGGWLTKTTADRIEDYTPEGITVRTRGIPRRG